MKEFEAPGINGEHAEGATLGFSISSEVSSSSDSDSSSSENSSSLCLGTNCSCSCGMEGSRSSNSCDSSSDPADPSNSSDSSDSDSSSDDVGNSSILFGIDCALFKKGGLEPKMFEGCPAGAALGVVGLTIEDFPNRPCGIVAVVVLAVDEGCESFANGLSVPGVLVPIEEPNNPDAGFDPNKPTLGL